MKVAVIGAGAAGLVMARELKRMQALVTVFEQSENIGGVWVYEAEVEDDPLGQEATKPVFSSLYESLRTNLPRDLMAFQDYSFDTKGGGADHWPRYPHHSKVLRYLQSFAKDFDITPSIRFEHTVTTITSDGSTGWLITTNQLPDAEHFDAVVVCNGHYSKPKVPEIEGIENFKGQVIHSHNYRNADIYKGKNVLVIGAAASGADISNEIGKQANKLIWCGPKFKLTTFQLPDGRILYPNPKSINAQGDIIFSDADTGKNETLSDIDVLMYCTGYEYQFPFLAPEILEVDENWVSPLYKDILVKGHPTLAPIGLPYIVVPFPLFEMQAKWVSRLLAEQWQLPNEADLDKQINTKNISLAERFKHKRHYHQLGEAQATYINDLAEQCGVNKLPQWFHDLYKEAEQARLADPFNFRDLPMQGHGPTVVLD